MFSALGDYDCSLLVGKAELTGMKILFWLFLTQPAPTFWPQKAQIWNQLIRKTEAILLTATFKCFPHAKIWKKPIDKFLCFIYNKGPNLAQRLPLGLHSGQTWFAVTWVFFWVHPACQKKKSFWDGKITLIVIYLTFEFFAPLHFVLLLFLQCAHYHSEFSLLKSTQLAISELTAPWNLIPTAFSSFHPSLWMGW